MIAFMRGSVYLFANYQGNCILYPLLPKPLTLHQHELKKKIYC